MLVVKKRDKILLEKTSKASKKFAGEFNLMLRHAEKMAKKLWENKEDEVWDKL